MTPTNLFQIKLGPTSHKKYFTEMSEAIYDENGEINLKNQLVIKTAGTLVFHPLELSKVLMQLGHEPLNPRQTKTLFGRPALAYPSVFKVRII